MIYRKIDNSKARSIKEALAGAPGRIRTNDTCSELSVSLSS
jgi:hypothetical protein